jgi:dihydrofolate reductase
MGMIISSINITPDGFCGHTEVVADEAHHHFATDLLRNSGAVVLGRVTYQLFESYWPSAARDPSLPAPMFKFARLIDQADKIVASRTLTKTRWGNTTILKEVSLNSVRTIQQYIKKDLLIFGNPSVVSALSKLGLIDEYYFSVQPMLAGNGKRLFENIHLDNSNSIELTGAKQFDSGVVVLCDAKKNLS